VGLWILEAQGDSHLLWEGDPFGWKYLLKRDFASFSDIQVESR
jgi:hypothetical protein